MDGNDSGERRADGGEMLREGRFLRSEQRMRAILMRRGDGRPKLEIESWKPVTISTFNSNRLQRKRAALDDENKLKNESCMKVEINFIACF
jgi:hypothetical protein